MGRKRHKTLPASLLVAWFGSLGPAGADQHDVRFNELMYHSASNEAHDEYLELYNMGTTSVDLSGWKFDNGIYFTFPGGTSIAAKDYLVVCADADYIRNTYGTTKAIGNWSGRLRNSGERVRLVNATGETIETFEYSDRDPFPRLPDGLGPSLERVNPAYDNDYPANWQPARVSGGWVHIVRSGGATSSRLYIHSEGPAEFLVDDVQIYPAGGGANHITNGGFESGLSPWSVTGNHSGSYVTTEDAHSGSRCMHIVATGAGASSGDSLNCTTSPGLDTGEGYTLDFWAKYISGTPEVFSRLSGGGIQGTTGLLSGGTPGVRNSVSTDPPEDSDIPPLVTDLRPNPILPRSTDTILMTALILDDSAIVRAQLTYNAGGGDQTIPMTDAANGLSGDGIYGAHIGPFADNTLVLFSVEAEDDGGNISRRPEEGSASMHRAFYVSDAIITGVPIPVYQIILAPADWTALRNAPKDYVPGTFIAGDTVYPDISVRYRGQSAIGWEKRHWKVKLNRSQLLPVPDFADPDPLNESEIRKVNINSSYGDKSFLREKLTFDLLRDAGVPSCVAWHVRLYVNGDYYGLYVVLDQPNEEFMEREGRDPDGDLYKAYASCEVLGSYGSYVSRYEKKINEDTTYDPLINFLETNWNTPLAGRYDFFDQNMNLQSFVNYLAAMCVTASADQFAKNYYVYQNGPGTGVWEMFGWDVDLTFGRDWLGCKPCLGYFNDKINTELFCTDSCSSACLNPHGQHHILLGSQQYPKCDGPWNRLMDRFWSEPTLRQMYYDRVHELLMTVLTEQALHPKLENYRTLLRNEAALDFSRWSWWGSDRSLDTQVNILKKFVTDRRDWLIDQYFGAQGVSDLVCTRTNVVDVVLTWQNHGDGAGGAYDRVIIKRNGLNVASLDGSSETYAERLESLSSGDTIRYGVAGYTGGQQTREASCIVVLPGSVLIDTDFSSDPSGEWQLNGSAIYDSGLDAVYITRALGNQAGSMFLNTPIPSGSFRATFEFEIGGHTSELPADGMTFAWITDGPTVIGEVGIGMAFNGLTGFAVEFDTWTNTEAPGEMGAPHIGLDDSRAGTWPQSVVSTPSPADLSGSGVWSAEVICNQGDITVTVENPGAGVGRTTVIDRTISNYPGDDSYFGFTASTGGANDNHIVRSFHLELLGVGEEPVASFTASPLSGQAPLQVRFTEQNPGGPVTARFWDFGDDTTSTAANPIHTYNQLGRYTVFFAVEGPGGVDTFERAEYIDVYESTEPLFLRGDANSDGVLGLADAVAIILFAYGGLYSPACMDACDANDSGNINMEDALLILYYLLGKGDPPRPPYPDPGQDPPPDPPDPPDPLGCEL